MARDFPGGSGNFLARVVPFTSLADFSAAFWILLDSTTAASDLAFLFGRNHTGGSGMSLGFQSAGGSTIRVIDNFVAFRGSGSALGTGSWKHVAVTRSGSGNWILYVDGSQIESVAAAPNALTGTDNIAIGGPGPSGAGGSIPGKMAEVGVWNAALSAAEVASLAKGFSPQLIRPQSLQSYCRVLGNDSPEQDLRGTAFTLTGTGAKADHPRVLLPRPAIYVP